MLALVLGLLLAGVPDGEFEITVQGMARKQGCEVQVVLTSESGDVRFVLATCPSSRVGLLWSRGENGWETVARFTAPYPSVLGRTEI